jgi:hypothetical protein
MHRYTIASKRLQALRAQSSDSLNRKAARAGLQTMGQEARKLDIDAAHMLSSSSFTLGDGDGGHPVAAQIPQ